MNILLSTTQKEKSNVTRSIRYRLQATKHTVCKNIQSKGVPFRRMFPIPGEQSILKEIRIEETKRKTTIQIIKGWPG
jgi:hypothetical protein